MIRNNRKLLCIVCTLGLFTLCCGEDIDTSASNDTCKTPGYVSCNDTCIDPTTSNQFCGANEYCEGYEVCKENQSCQNGQCVDNSQCTDGKWKCDGNTLSRCTDGKWGNHQTCEGNTKCDADAGACKEKGCEDTEHLFAGKCEADDLTHCGTHTNDCTKTAGWKSGECIGKKCFAEGCEAGYHLASLFDDDNEERTICEEDTHDACGSVNNKCGAEEICTLGECKDSCQPGEVICGGSCINPNTNTKFCGADTSCQNYIACSESENCVGGKCAISSCQNADETICTENQQSICVNIHGSNPNHCGGCNAACADKDTARASGCKQGQCTYTCHDGMANCGSDTEPMCLSEDQLKSDALHCGKCDTKCGANEFCQNGQCVANSCDGNQCLFNNVCVNQNDYCGTQCVNCNMANNASAGVCQNGSCTISACAVGYHLTGGGCEIDSATACPNGNVNGTTTNCTTLDHTKAGICEEGMCKPTECEANFHIKGNSCVEDTKEACGSEDNDCTKLAGWKAGACENGKCIATTCQTGYHTYNGACEADSLTNCGEHGNKCNNIANAASYDCANGKCTFKCNEGYAPLVDSCGPADFVTVWNVTAENLHIKFPVRGNDGNIIIDWGDGTQPTGSTTPEETELVGYKYSKASKYKITVQGKFNGWSCRLPGDNTNYCDQLVEIISYGNTIFDRSAFKGAKQLTSLPKEGTPRFKNSDMSGVFAGASSFNQNINFWNTSKIKDMSGMFSGASAFNQPLDNWDTSNVTNMSNMFYGATAFNQPLNNWDTSSVTNMMHMFERATAFNQPLNNWDTSNVTNMKHMFDKATAFNQPLNNWDTSNVTNMSYMFYGATAFNGALNNWDTSNVTDMSHMFENAAAFNQPLNNWDTSNVTNMSSMFYGATDFDQPLDKWNISNVTNMSQIFIGTELQQDNYCKLFKGPYAAIWTKFKDVLGKKYECN